ncbi:MAG: DNA repair protein RadC [Spirochaetaceae bacterium]|jgi:DNA repair protein RadC|nr:DNA repair protein RadC [Spirochaetaceae bacterium]
MEKQTNAEAAEEQNFSYSSRICTGLADIPLPERPRERLGQYGPSSLSDRDLLAVILNSGIRGKNVLVLARELLKYLDRIKGMPSIQDLSGMGGLGVSKAGTILAMLEFGRRRWGPSGSRINHPSDAFTLIRHYADRKQEQFLCLSLNGAHELLAVRMVTLGLVNKTMVHPREVFSDPLSDRASAVIVAHNHPSGQLSPSTEDEEITCQLAAAAKILGIRFLDHVIFSETGYYSFVQSGKLSETEVSE